MDKKSIIIFIVVMMLAAVALSFVFNSPANDVKESNIYILNNNTLGKNNTLYVKLTDGANSSLDHKKIHITVTDENGTQVVKKEATTQFTGVARVQINDLANGTYKVNVTFDGDENYTASSSVKEITIGNGVVAEDIDLNIPDTDDNQDSQSNTQTQSNSYSQSSNSPQRQNTPSPSQDSGYVYYDENGRETLPEYDENGNEV